MVKNVSSVKNDSDIGQRKNNDIFDLNQKRKNFEKNFINK